jgi:topoisomerase IV subunit A
MALPASGDIRETEFDAALGERYLSYALSTIMSRSLPDVRDGLKPVHRRLLFAMRELKLDPLSGYKKCARVVGDVIGKYHPHGDVAVYDTLARLAQDFAVRYPLVDGQGNFGSIDGDNPAAMRYTEARLTPIAETMLRGIDEDAVDFRTTYDGEGREPVVLPSAFPNLLANGAQGIAVGMATAIPPHNVGEICKALQHLIKYPKATSGKLIELMPGPDFPTGGILVESAAAIAEAYRTGRGSLRLRAHWEREDLDRGQYRIVVKEIPYQVPKSRLIERIAELLHERKLPLLEDIRDESTDEVRLILIPRSRTVEAEHLMESLFRATDLEVRVALNMNVVDADGVPNVLGLRDVLQAFLDHRHEVLVRRSKFRLAEIERRLEVLAGFLIAFLNLDKVIKIIRTHEEPKAELMRRFKLSDLQAESILNMRLRSLRKLEELEIKREHGTLTEERKDINALLKSVDKRWQRVAGEIAEIEKQFGSKTTLGRRRTKIADAPAPVEIKLDVAVEREPITVLVSEKGWIRAFKGHLTELGEVKYKEGDGPRFILHAETSDKILLFASNGRFYTLPADRLPPGRGHGEPVRLMIDLGVEHDLVTVLKHRPGGKLVVAARDGRGFLVQEDLAVAQTRAGKQVLNLPPGIAAAIAVSVPAEADALAFIGENRKLLIVKLAEVPELARGRGMILQRYRDGGLSDAKAFALKQGLSWKSGDRERVETDLRAWIGARGQSGRMPPNGFPRSNRFA